MWVREGVAGRLAFFAVAGWCVRHFRRGVRVIQGGRGLPGARPKHNGQYANHRATSRRLHWLDSFRNEPVSHLFEQAQAFFSSTPLAVVRILTIPCSRRRVRTLLLPPAPAPPMVGNYA